MNKMRPKHRQKPKKGQLPILIRYRAQDYTTRYLDDPRILYIEEFHDLHRDDGFVAMIPPAKRGRTWWTICKISLGLVALSMLVWRLL